MTEIEQGSESNTISVELLKGIDSVDGSLWDSLAPDDDPFSSYRFMQSVEKAGFAGCEFWYLIFRQQRKPVATAAFYSARVDAELLTAGRLRSVLGAIKRVARRFLAFRVLFCGLPVSVGKNSVRMAEGVDKAAVLNLLWKSMVQIARKERIQTLVLKEFDRAEAAEYGELQSLGLHRVDSLPTNELSIEWSTYDGYLSALRHRYRQSILRSWRKFEVPEIEVRTFADYGERYSEEIYRLYLNVLEAVPYRLETLPRQFFLNISAHFGTDAELIVVRRRDRPVGKILMLYSPNRAFAMFLGMDYSVNQTHDLYFNLLAQIIKRAIEKGKRTLELGQSSYQAKGRMGAEARPLYLYIRHLNPLWNALMRRASSWLFPGTSISPHTVFK